MSITTTHIHTVTFARHIASKMGADLKRVQRMFGNRQIPSDSMIDDFEREVVLLLRHQCLKEVIYGFQQENEWTFAIKYLVGNGKSPNTIGDADSALPYVANVGDFYSVLTYSRNWQNLASNVKSKIPVSRVSCNMPVMAGGWDDGRRYLSDSFGMECVMYKK